MDLHSTLKVFDPHWHHLETPKLHNLSKAYYLFYLILHTAYEYAKRSSILTGILMYGFLDKVLVFPLTTRNLHLFFHKHLSLLLSDFLQQTFLNTLNNLLLIYIWFFHPLQILPRDAYLKVVFMFLKGLPDLSSFYIQQYLCLYMCIHNLHAQCLQKPEQSIGSLGNGVKDGCNLS